MISNVRFTILSLIATLAVTASSAHAAPDAPVNIAFSPANPDAGIYFVTWQNNYKAEWYEIWEIDKGGTSALLGTTPFPYWQFTSHIFGAFRYEIRTCYATKCSSMTESKWVDVGVTATSSNAPSESVCGPSDPPPDVETAWSDYYDKVALSGTFPSQSEVGDTGLTFGSKNYWSIGDMIAPNYDLADPEFDSDGDCLPDYNDPFPLIADVDSDGWLDGPCNQRWRLVLTEMTAIDEAEDSGRDETYLIVDGIRFPHTNNSGDDANNDYWRFDDDTVYKDMELVVAERTVGSLQGIALTTATITGMEDDPDPWGNWSSDDTLFEFYVPMTSRSPGETFTVEESHGDWHYRLKFRIDLEGFADPDPDPWAGHNADTDRDGLSDREESTLTNWLGGRADPTRRGIYIEVDNVRDGDSHARALWQVGTAFAIKDVYVAMYKSTSLPRDRCVTRDEAVLLDQNEFSLGYLPGFRHAVLALEMFNCRSGVNLGRSFLVSTPSLHFPWGEERAIAGTFMHELGHSLGLFQTDFPLIDNDAFLDWSPNLSYQSSMTYFFQPLMVDYSDNAGGFGDNFDDWEHLNVDTPTISGQSGLFAPSSGFTPGSNGFGGLKTGPGTTDDCDPALPSPSDC